MSVTIKNVKRTAAGIHTVNTHNAELIQRVNARLLEEEGAAMPPKAAPPVETVADAEARLRAIGAATLRAQLESGAPTSVPGALVVTGEARPQHVSAGIDQVMAQLSQSLAALSQRLDRLEQPQRKPAKHRAAKRR